MKHVKGILQIVYCVGLLSIPIAHAEDLIQVYSQAVSNDPVFAKAHATWLSQKMNFPIARSSVLPSIALTGNGARNYSYVTPPSLAVINNYNWTYGYSLSLNNAIFDMGAWASIRNAEAIVKSATASYIAAQQSLIQRTTKAYFDVMAAYETLYFTLANKKAVTQQYEVSQKKFKTGLIAIMDVYDARSRLDQVSSEEITAKNNLAVQIENLRSITGHYYKKLKGLDKKLTLLRPTPNNIDQWITRSEKQNYNIEAQFYNVIAALEKIRQQSAGYAPTLDFSTGVSEAQGVDSGGDKTRNDNIMMGLNLSYQPIQGGLTYASEKQARYNYTAASSELEAVYRQVHNQARTSYISIVADINHTETDRKHIVSSRQALAATEVGLKVGTRTMVDVLNDLGTVYQAQRQYINDQYTYLNDMIDLKIAAGTLSPNDVAEINRWLTKSVTLPAPTL